MTESETTKTNGDTRNRRPTGLDAGTLRKSGIVIVLTVLLAMFAVFRLPDSVVVFWDASGNSVVTLPKLTAVASVLVVQVIILGIFAIAPRVNSIDKTVASVRDAYQWTAFALVSLVLLVFATIVAWNSGLRFGGGQPLLTRIGALVAAILLYSGSKALPGLEQNRFVGIRSPWAMSDETVWNRTHAHAVPFFKATAAIAALAAAAPSVTVCLVLIVVPLLSVLGYLYYYSYRLYDG